jgi:hypothetical protein
MDVIITTNFSNPTIVNLGTMKPGEYGVVQSGAYVGNIVLKSRGDKVYDLSTSDGWLTPYPHVEVRLLAPGESITITRR